MATGKSQAPSLRACSLGVVLLLSCSSAPHVDRGAAGHAGTDAGAADSGKAGRDAGAAYSGAAGRDAGTANSGRGGGSAGAATGGNGGRAGTDSGMGKDPCATNNGGCGDASFWTCTNNAGAAPTCSNHCSVPNVCSVDYTCKELTPGETCRGQFADWPPAYSASAFTVNADGTVTDSRSGLVWQQVVNEGTHYFAEAQTLCAGLSLAGTGWRVPTKAELESIVDRSRYNPAIDPTAFPDTPADRFWSSSLLRVFSGTAYYVNFSGGNSDRADTLYPSRVRCVR